MALTKNLTNARPSILYSQISVVATGVAILLSTPVAVAQPISTPQPAIHNMPPYCQHSTLTGIEFMKLIQTIIIHGDLTDIAFIKKTLGTKFSSSYGWTVDEKPDHQILKLRSDKVLGNQIHVGLIIFYAKLHQQIAGIIAGLGFGGPPNFIADCLHIPIFYFSSFFGGNFAGLPTGEGIPTASATNVTGIPGKNGTQLHITFDYGFDKNIVTGVSVYEQP